MTKSTEAYTSWAEAVLGGKCVAVRSAGAGASRATWLIDIEKPTGAIEPAVLRIDTGDGPLTGTEVSLEREGAVYRALQGRGLPIASFGAISEDGLALILGRLEGTAEWGESLEAPARDTVVDEFVDAIVALHALDAAELDIPGMRIVHSSNDHARNELDLWEGILTTRVTRPSPAVRYAFHWMRRHAPECSETVLCHGDPGPGNFMHQDGHLSGLIDWEFAHFGDPMAFRGRAGGFAWPLESIFRKYAEVSGRALDRRRIEYYQLFTILRMAVCCLVGMEDRQGGMNANIYFSLYPSLEVLLPLAISSMVGLETPRPLVDDEVVDELPLYIEQEFLPRIANDIDDPLVRMRLLSVTPLLGHLRARLGIGTEVDALNLDTVADALGKRFESWPQAERGIDGLLRSGEVDDEIVLPMLTSVGLQRARLWPGGGPGRMTVPDLPDWLGT